jgi:hypothetical protein
VNWNQPICEHCWYSRHPDREPSRVTAPAAVIKTCAYCGRGTHAGIYVRDDPRQVPFPSQQDET